MKVLFIQNIEGIGGSENYFLELLPKLKEKGIEVCFLGVFLKEKEKEMRDFEQKLNQLNILNETIRIGSYYSARPLVKIHRYLKKNQFDIVHTHLVYADFWIATLKKLGRLKNTVTISTIHGYSEDVYREYCLKPEEAPRNRYYKLVKFAHKYIDHTYACSYGLQNFYRGLEIEVKGGMDVIEHGFNFPEFQGRIEPSEYVELLIVGRLMPIKQHDLVLRMLPEILKQFSNVRLNIVGIGAEEERLKQLSQELKLGDQVVFHGFSNQVEKHYTHADIVLVPSYAEGLPLVILEAFNYRKPVIGFRTIGCQDVIQDGENGYLIKPYDSDEFQEKLLELISNKDLRERMGQNGRKLVDEKYNIEVMTNNTITYYQNALAQ